MSDPYAPYTPGASAPADPYAPYTGGSVKQTLTGVAQVPPQAAATAVNAEKDSGVPAAVGMTAPEFSAGIAQRNRSLDQISNSPALQRWTAGPASRVAATQDDFGPLGKVLDYVSAGGPLYNDLTGPMEAAWQQATLAGQRLEAAQASGDILEELKAQKDNVVAAVNLASSPVTSILNTVIRPTSQGLAEAGIKAPIGPSEMAELTGLFGLDPALGVHAIQSALAQPTTVDQSQKNISDTLFLASMLLPIPKLGEARPGTALALTEADRPISPVPLSGAPVPEAGVGWKVGPEGHVVDESGAPVTWDSPKAAARWVQSQGYKWEGSNQSFELATGDQEGTWTVKQSQNYSGEVPSGPAPTGAGPVTDILHAQQADIAAASVAKAQELLSETATLGRSPQIVEEALGQELAGKFAYVDPQMLQMLKQEGHVVFEDKHDQLVNAIATGRDIKVPLEQYLAETSGKPFAEELNGVTRFSADGVSQAEGKELLEDQKAPEELSPVQQFLQAHGDSEHLPALMSKLEDALSAGGTFSVKTSGVDYQLPKSTLDNPLYKELEAAGLAKNEGVIAEHHLEDLHDRAQKLLYGPTSPEDPPFVKDVDEEFLAKNATNSVLQASPEAKAALAAAQRQIKDAIKSAYLKQIFEGPKAVGMTKGQFAAHSQLVQAAHAARYRKLLDRAVKTITRSRKAEWKASWNQHFPQVVNDIMSDPRIAAYQTLKFSDETSDLVKGNALVKGNPPRPITYYHGSNHVNIEAWTVPEYSSYKVISFATDPHFASNWALGKGNAPHGDPTVYVVHIKAKNPADFRKPEDVDKAAKWLAAKSFDPSGPLTKEAYINSIKPDLRAGSWALWERPDMWKALGWDAAHMKESPGQSNDLPNICIEDGNKVFFKYKDGTVVNSMRLSNATKKLYPDLMEGQPTGIFSKDGVSADDAARELGFHSGKELLENLRDFEASRKASGLSYQNYLKKLFFDEATRRTAESTGLTLDANDIKQEALNSVTAPEVGDVLTAELKDLAKEVSVPLDLSLVKANALYHFSQMEVGAARDIKELERAFKKGGDIAERNLLKGKAPEAFTAKLQQFAAWNQLVEAHAFAKSYNTFQKKVARWSRKAVLKGQDQKTLNFIRAILEDIGLPVKQGKFESVKEALQGQTLESFVQELQDKGLAPVQIDLSPVGKGGLDSYTVEQYLALKQMLESFANIGRDLDKVRAGAEKALLSDLTTTIRQNAQLVGRRFSVTEMRAARKDLEESLLRSTGAAVSRPETYLYWMDHESIGPFMKYVIDPLTEGAYHEADMVKEISDGMRAFIKSKSNTTWLADLEKDVNIPELLYSAAPEDKPIQWVRTKKEAIMTALYLGQESALKKLLQGYNWDEMAVRTALNRELSKDDWDFVQHWWNVGGKLWPKIAQLGRDTRGLAPKKEPAMPVETPHGTYPGGYFHIRYDRSAQGIFKNAEGETIEVRDPGQMSEDSLWGKNSRGAVPASGYTVSRIESNKNPPVDLNFNTLHLGTSEIIHDLAFRAPLIQALKIFNNPAVREAIRATLGPEYLKETDNWLRYIARQKLNDSRSLDYWLNRVRQVQKNFVAMNVGYNPATIVKHSGIGLAHIATEVGLGNFAKAFSDIQRQPELLQFVMDNSGYVRNILTSGDRDIREVVQTLNAKQGFVTNYQAGAFWLFSYMKKIEATGTWLAKYRMALEDTGDHAEAQMAANKSVRDTQGAGTVADLAALWRSSDDFWHGAGRMMNLFTGFENAQTNREWLIMRRLVRAATDSKGYEQRLLDHAGQPKLLGFKDTGGAGTKRDIMRSLADTWGFVILGALYVTAAENLMTGNTEAYGKIANDLALGDKVDAVKQAEKISMHLGDLFLGASFKSSLGGSMPMGNAVGDFIQNLMKAIYHGMTHHGEKARDNIAESVFEEMARPAIDTAEDIGKGVHAASRAVEGKYPSDKDRMSPRWIQHAVQTVGYAMGWPLHPVANAGQYIWDYNHNKVGPDRGPFEFTRGVTFGPKTQTTIKGK